jgi:threonine/homoserine/homoserine lactone efflux protein
VPDSSIGPILAFAAVAATLVVTPGVGTASLIAVVAAQGRRAGYLMAAGMVLGAALYALGAALGTTALLRVFPQAVRWIAIAGGVFISALGLRGIVAAMRAPRAGAVERPKGRHTLVTTGLFIALGNAPLPLFYLVVVPQYVPKSMSPFGGAILLSSMHLLMAGTWMTTLVTLLGRIVEVLRRPGVLLSLRVLTGTTLILLGVKSISGAL